MTSEAEAAHTTDPQRAAVERRLDGARQGVFDVAIVGGGVNGAAVFRELARRGFRALLVERGDFAGGTSQASGMLVWGGLLYLRRLELGTVRALSRARDTLLAEAPEEVARAPFRYLPLRRRSGTRPAWLVRLALELYWHLGSRARSRPRRTREVPAFLRAGRFAGSLTYDEAALVGSDARCVLGWVLAAEDEHRLALDHVAAAGFRREDGLWHVALEDQLTGDVATARARLVVNAAGVHADEVARRMGVRTRHRHAFSKGVYLGLTRPPELDEFLAFEHGEHGDTQTFTPFGPIALWGPTETFVDSLEGAFEPDVDDVRQLLAHARQNLGYDVGPEDIVSLRTGVRPLACSSSSTRPGHPLDMSRRHVCDADVDRAALTIFGGKFTGAASVAREVVDTLGRAATPRGAPVAAGPRAHPAPNFRFSGLEAPLIDPAHAARHEHCRTLLDYTRRRTNLSQWTRRHGLGLGDVYAPELCRIAAAIVGEARADGELELARGLARRHDALLAQV